MFNCCTTSAQRNVNWQINKPEEVSKELWGRQATENGQKTKAMTDTSNDLKTHQFYLDLYIQSYDP